jgi:hypothetical protein
MKTLSTASLIDIQSHSCLSVLLATLALLLSRIHLLGTLILLFCAISCSCHYAYARKRVANRIIHHRKYAPFPGYPNGINSCSGKEYQSIGI